ncbi:MAG: ATP-binding cassette domain-containing protein [Rickettsiales bacterium]|nr:ATP-binding cassette domain-containing protein [Rickettsiales bacterium]
MIKAKNIFHYLKPYKFALCLFVICVVFSSTAILALGKGLAYFIDVGFKNGDKIILLKSLYILFFIIVILAISMFGRFFIITYYGTKISNDIRKDLFNHLIFLSAEFYEKNKIGKILSHITSDLEILQNVITNSLSILLRNSLLFIGCLIILISIDYKLTFTVFILIPLVIFPIIIIGKRLKNTSKIAQDKMGVISSVMEEYLSFVKLIQSFANEDYAKQKFAKAIDNFLLIARQRILLRSILTVTVIILVFSGVGAILYHGGNLVFSNKLTVGEFSSFIFYTTLMAGSFGALSETAGNIQKARGSTERIFNLLKEPNSIKNGQIKLTNFNKLEFKNVSFSYPTRKNHSINNINFTINPKETVAIIGKSGAGKTTIFELIQRFYDINSGDILINGKNIKDYSLKTLRDIFSLVSQDSHLFSNTVLENLKFANKNANIKEIKNALKQSGAEEFIKNLPKKYDTHLGEKGVRISGGEKQRLAIARSLLKDSEVILLDEPTSQLDSENEKILQNFLKELAHQKTVIIIAHRLSTIKHADKILVLDKGKIVEFGSYKELVKKNQIFKKLLDLQYDN